MRIVYPTRSRTGSQFVMQLAGSIDSAYVKGRFATINSYRNNTRESVAEKGCFKEEFSKGQGIDHLEKKLIRRMKFEDPGSDSFILQVAERYPDCRFIASHRAIEKVINSHYNIKSWGHSLADVVFQYSSCLHLYEKLHLCGRLFLIDVDSPESFSINALCSFLKGSPTDKTNEIVESWTPTNTLGYQLKNAKNLKNSYKRNFFNLLKVTKESNFKFLEHPMVKDLRKTHFWINDADRRYNYLVAASSQY